MELVFRVDGGLWQAAGSLGLNFFIGQRGQLESYLLLVRVRQDPSQRGKFHSASQRMLLSPPVLWFSWCLVAFVEQRTSICNRCAVLIKGDNCKES